MDGVNRWQALHRLLNGQHRFLLTSHLFPDGDSIGSEVALALHLRSLGKDVVVLNETPAPDRYAFLTRHFPIQALRDLESLDHLERPDVVICLDFSSWDYTGLVGRYVRQCGSPIVAIDHHQVHGRFGDLDLVMEDAAASGEIVYRYLRAVGAPVTPPMAEAIYASILFDTQGLRLGNAQNATVRTAAELLECGVDHRSVCRNLFEIDSWAKIELLRHALWKLRRACDGRLAWLDIPEDLFRVTGARFVDGDGILDELLALRDLEICVLFREMGRDGVKATFRAKHPHDVGRLAAELGGGGRSGAAGVFLPGSLHQAMDVVLPRLHSLLDTGTEASIIAASN